MRSARIPQILMLVWLASTAVWAAPAVDTRGGAAPVAVSSLYSVAFHVQLASAPPRGASVLCRARIVPNAPGLGNLRLDALPTATGRVLLAGSNANCRVEIPFTYTLGAAQNGAALSYEIEVVGGSESSPAAMGSSAQRSVGVAYPAPGGVANLDIQLSF
jgi:hypothetical protein